MILRTADFYACRHARSLLNRAVNLRDVAHDLERRDAGIIAVAVIRGHMRQAAREAVRAARRTKALHAQPDSEIGQVALA